VATVEQGLQTQLRNIEATYGRSIDEWVDLVESRGLRRHGEIVAMLKNEYGMAHGAANRVALVALDQLDGHPKSANPVDDLIAGRPAHVQAIVELVLAAIDRLGSDVGIAPKKGYVSLRRRVQFGMIQPTASYVNVGLVLRGVAVTDRLESAASFNALFTHRVRVKSVDDVDADFKHWLERAYQAAG
jgi:hypothetical protein